MGYSPWGHKELDTTEVTEHARSLRPHREEGKEGEGAYDCYLESQGNHGFLQQTYL